jgi:hypothetical protein
MRAAGQESLGVSFARAGARAATWRRIRADGEPGTKSLWLGLQYLDVMTVIWKILDHPAHSPPVSS